MAIWRFRALRALLSCDCGYAGRNVRGADGGGGLVALLAAGAGAAEGFPAAVAGEGFFGLIAPGEIHLLQVGRQLRHLVNALSVACQRARGNGPIIVDL